MNHTPTPWRLGKIQATAAHGYGHKAHAAYTEICGADGRRHFIGGIRPHEDAAFIVRACNSHEALVAVTEKFLDLCPRMNEDDPVAPALFDACEQAMAALKLAKGE